MHWYACINVPPLDGLSLAMHCELVRLAGEVADKELCCLEQKENK